MGLSGNKTVTNNDPWAPAQPYIIKGMEQTNDVFDANQSTLQNMSGIAQDAFKEIAPGAFGANSMVSAAQDSAGKIGSGSMLGTNPGGATYSRLMQPGGDGSLDAIRALMGGGSNGAMPGLSDIGANGGGITASGVGARDVRATTAPNMADRLAMGTATGGFMGSNPSGSYYDSELRGDFLNGNPYLDAIVKQSTDAATKAANQRFAAAGMGEGMSTPYASVVSRNVADAANALRGQAYDADRNRQLAAAGQADSVWNSERGRMMDATGLISSNYNSAADRDLSAQTTNAANDLDASKANASFGLDAGKANLDARLRALGLLSDASGADFNQRLAAANALGARTDAGNATALDAARTADTAQQNQVQQMLAALGLIPGLREADYAGITPALSLLNTAADLPYIGTAALNGQIRQASNGYGTTTSKTSGNIGQSLMSLGGQLGAAYLGK